VSSILSLSKTALLNRAKEFYFSLGVDDGAASLCRANFNYGLAKLHFSQEKMGITPNATFISTPDETISRNATRWASGYGYGGKLTTGNSNDPIIFVDTKPNVCGMLVGGLQELPSPDEIIKNINKVINSEIYIDDIKIEWDYKKSNHFIDVFKTKRAEDCHYTFPPYMFIIHGSLPELRKKSNDELGLYYDFSKVLMDMCEIIETPFGKTYCLQGENAKEYYQFYLKAKNLAARKRIMAAKLLFGDFQVISNPVHQGLMSYGEMLLGAQHISEDSRKIFPVALRSDLPSYLISALPNLTEDQIDNIGFENRAKRNGVLSHLQNFNVLPHGGGYTLPHINHVKKVLEIEKERFFVCEQENEDATMIFSDITATQFLYRGKKIIRRIEELNLGRIEAKLVPKFILKI